jgi:hypothetical protein
MKTLACLLLAAVVAAEEPVATEYLHGMSRVKHGSVCHGTAIDSTLRYSNGSEIVRLTIFQPLRRNVAVTPPFVANVTASARVDGSEMVEIEGWGTVELWPSEAGRRREYAGLAPASETHLSLVWIAAADAEGFDIFVVDAVTAGAFFAHGTIVGGTP